MLAARLDNLRQQLKAQSVDCLALVPGPNLRYLTGTSFHLMERAFVALFPAEAEPVRGPPGDAAAGAGTAGPERAAAIRFPIFRISKTARNTAAAPRTWSQSTRDSLAKRRNSLMPGP